MLFVGYAIIKDGVILKRFKQMKLDDATHHISINKIKKATIKQWYMEDGISKYIKI